MIVTGFLFGCRVCIEFQRFVIALHIIMNLFNRRIENLSFATSIFKFCCRLKSQSREMVSIIADFVICVIQSRKLHLAKLDMTWIVKINPD